MVRVRVRPPATTLSEFCYFKFSKTLYRHLFRGRASRSEFETALRDWRSSSLLTSDVSRQGQYVTLNPTFEEFPR
jgi:hypothetical protein